MQNRDPAERIKDDTIQAEAPTSESDSIPGTILVVDDSVTNQTLLQRRLEREGYRVLKASSGQAALDYLQTEPIGLILLDLMMPEMDGEEVLQRMQADERLSKIPVIMVTASDEHECVQRCLQCGAKGYIPKPFDPAQLRASVHTYLPLATPSK